MSFRSTAPRLPLSPASSPDQGVKQQTKTDCLVASPISPHSPVSMSVATKRYVPTYTNGGHTNEMANRSPDSFIAQPPRQQPTPVNTQTQSATQQPNMLKRSAPQDEDERPTSKRQKQDSTANLVEAEPPFTPTNHDREEKFELNGLSHPTVSFNDNVQAQAIAGDSKVDSDPIFKDVGAAFRIGKSIHNRATVDLNQHMLGKYGLHPLLSQVARFDPKTDDKINKLRKSYEGQIKIAKFPGKTGAHKSERDIDNFEPSKLRKLATMPEEQFAASHTDRKIGDFSGFDEIIKSALQINPGAMNDKTRQAWEEVLGLEAVGKVPQRPNGQMLPQNLPSTQLNGVRPVPQATDLTDRHTRKKKRSYLDNSFTGYEGYGEGHSDPEGEYDKDYDYADRAGKRRRRD